MIFSIEWFQMINSIAQNFSDGFAGDDCFIKTFNRQPGRKIVKLTKIAIPIVIFEQTERIVRNFKLSVASDF